MKSFLKIYFLFLVVLFSNNARAFWFFDEEKTTEEVLFRSLEPEEVLKYKNLFNIFEQRQEEFVVFDRVLKEKQDEVNEYDKILSTQYGIVQSRSYSYNPTNLTITVVFTENNEVKSLPHRIFVTKEEGDLFIKYVRGKQIAIQQQQLIETIQLEKKAEFDSIQKVLTSTFGMKADKKYRFDEQKRKIYEIRKLKTEAERKAEKELIKKNRIIAERKAEEVRKQKEEEKKKLVDEEKAKKAKEKALKEKAKQEEINRKEQEKALKEKAKQEEKERKIALKKEEKKLVSNIEFLEHELSTTNKKIKKFKSEINEIAEEISSLEEDLKKLRNKNASFEKQEIKNKEINVCRGRKKELEKFSLDNLFVKENLEKKLKEAQEQLIQFKEKNNQPKK